MFIWIAFSVVFLVPIVLAANSPLLAWRQPVYIAAGFAGVIAMGLLLLQPLLAGGFLFTGLNRWQLHRWAGVVLLLLVVIHVVGLWITSPPDVIDALLFVSATPFSIWGVIAMWGIFATACLAILRSRRRIRPRSFRLTHKTLAGVIVVSSVVHAMMIEGTMEIVSKSVLCAFAVVATGVVLAGRFLRK